MKVVDVVNVVPPVTKMPNNIIGIVADGDGGGTFLSWTIHYLSGQDHYYYCKQNQWINLTNDPLTNTNSHNFYPNQPKTTNEFYEIFNKLENIDAMHCLYFHEFKEPDENGKIKIVMPYNEVNYLQSTVKKGINLTFNKHHNAYKTAFISRSNTAPNWTNYSVPLASSDESFNSYIDRFFNKNKQKWDDPNLTNSWDKREFIALNFNFKEHTNMHQSITDYSSNSFYELNCLDLFTQFDITVYKMFDYLNLIINTDRFEKWSRVYNKWKKLHYTRLRFIWYFDTIIKSILYGKSMDLQEFNLTILQEAAIQQSLIYDYSLNLKTWQLEKFINTKQLHDLLEPNSHPHPVKP